MPIFEYACGECKKSFELLVRSDTRIVCPSCSSENVKKKLSLFASVVKKNEPAMPACHTGHCDLGRCGSGFCGVE
jgi:putative FmdB family regulatory protein